MKLLMACLQCIQTSNRVPGVVYVEVKNDNFYSVTCPVGHEYSCVLQDPRFELLFDSGLLALLDGYTRESVGSFSASVERFYEYWLDVSFLKAGVRDKFSDVWKKHLSLSERQLGAFIIGYLKEHQRCPPLLSQENTKFRNRVIHKGYFPTSEETFQYANTILKYIVELLKELNIASNDAINMARALQVYDAQKSIAIPQLPATMGIMTTIQHMVNRPLNEVTIEKALEHIRSIKGLYSPPT